MVYTDQQPELRMLDYLNLPGLKTIRAQSIGESELLVDVEGGFAPECCATPNCTGGRLLGHGSKEVIFHDIPRDGQWIRVRLKRRRVRCSTCGKTASYMVNAFDADRNMTFRLKMDIEKHCLQETYVSIARRVGLDESTVRAITKAHIERLDLKYRQSVLTPAVLGIDEFVIYRKPSAILTNIEARTIYEVLPTRKNVDLEPALRTVVEAGNLRVVVTDMCEAYIRLSQRLAPTVPVVVDRFHVVRMANDVLDSVRKRVQRTLPDGERQALLKERWVFLSNEEDLLPDARECRDAWFRTFPELADAYHVKEAFRRIYELETRTSADQAFSHWRNTLPETVSKDFIRIGYTYSRFRDEILNFFDHRSTAGFTESVNRVAKDMNRLGRGYSWEVLRARLIHHVYARQMGRKKVKKKTIEALSLMVAANAGMPQFRTRWEDVTGDWGTDVDTLLEALQAFPDYRPQSDPDAGLNLTTHGMRDWRLNAE